jgi:hypothetical protein
VTRADNPYILSLVNLYRSMYPDALPLIKMQDANPHLQKGSTSNVPDSQLNPVLVQDTDVNQGRNEVEEIWSLPSPDYHHVGERLLLLRRILTKDIGDNRDGEGQLELRAVKIGDEYFRKLLFCRIAVHRRVCYAERVGLIIRGHFNGKNGWES